MEDPLYRMIEIATGTVRANRLRGAEKILKTRKELKKHKYDYCYETNNKLFVTRWQDNVVISNFKSVDSVTVSQRWSKTEKKKVNVEQPGLIHDHNQHMGGVDLHDNAVANYRIGIRGKKWWWPLWTNSVNSTTVNPWKIH
ncbi:PREDICTED: piggyBac transposable element-derived protein 2-like [Rhagoletis zephyria]|uniref:piggyBac transposable element-derived protein 2-like n=1 Tax=Rhagoletis zephyria TaxID=28612 RepID=UPI0008114AA6|nr:PREDICTED: piggyBac transposable element-derived protein 2-like [Rhagoletis zephyria]